MLPTLPVVCRPPSCRCFCVCCLLSAAAVLLLLPLLLLLPACCLQRDAACLALLLPACLLLLLLRCRRGEGRRGEERRGACLACCCCCGPRRSANSNAVLLTVWRTLGEGTGRRESHVSPCLHSGSASYHAVPLCLDSDGRAVVSRLADNSGWGEGGRDDADALPRVLPRAWPRRHGGRVVPTAVSAAGGSRGCCAWERRR